ncbi:MAG: c-type cytochrome [Marinospirillum sp.]|uniref:cytochrome-c peroxidase n=1 Tax=Marinospirillum sp. TaxID=2183934 RepID=UPI001A0A9326|nr:cytochrome c peroxidase [Marinospirillum sp.]MBE0508567.1 c-type cytochrome [Marinospirillum sp.]
MNWKTRITKTLPVFGAVGLLAISGSVLAGDGFHSKYADRFEALPAIAPIPADNSLTEAKIELGKMLFFEPRISGSGVISCATCHNPALGWADRIPRATGHDGQVGDRNTPTVLNSGFFGAQFWDGRAATLEDQALGPIEAGIEMNMPLEQAIARLKEFDAYKKAFAAAYGGNGERQITEANVAKALASFQRTLNTPNSPFDRYLSGDLSALTDQQKRGMAAFADNGCTACHSGPALTDSLFHAIQVPGSTDLGRYLVTGDEGDKHRFKTPTLRNVAVTYPYFNNGGTATLEEAVQIMGKEMLGREFNKRTVNDIVAFLHSLTGEMPHVEIPALP